MRQEGEPSVDQILQSIKRVMARDRRPPADDPHPAEAAHAYDTSAIDIEPADADEAAELHELGGEMLPPAEAEHLLGEPDAERLVLEPDEVEAAGDDLIEDEADGEAEGFAGHTPPASEDAAPDHAEEPQSTPDAASAEALAGSAATESMRRSLAALSMLAQPGAPLPNSPAGAASLDAIVREMLRPMLAQWLDTHLPSLVEREVRAEIARITGAAPGA